MWANSKDAETQKKHLTQQPHVKNQISLFVTLIAMHDRGGRWVILFETWYKITVDVANMSKRSPT